MMPMKFYSQGILYDRFDKDLSLCTQFLVGDYVSCFFYDFLWIGCVVSIDIDKNKILIHFMHNNVTIFITQIVKTNAYFQLHQLFPN